MAGRVGGEVQRVARSHADTGEPGWRGQAAGHGGDGGTKARRGGDDGETARGGGAFENGGLADPGDGNGQAGAQFRDSGIAEGCHDDRGGLSGAREAKADDFGHRIAQGVVRDDHGGNGGGVDAREVQARRQPRARGGQHRGQCPGRGVGVDQQDMAHAATIRPPVMG